MSEITADIVIAQTRKWIEKVVIGLNFCPFANRVVKNNEIRFEVLKNTGVKEALAATSRMFEFLKNDTSYDTAFIIFQNDFTRFRDYLMLVNLADDLIKKQKLRGVFQIASFHPDYVFAGSQKNDPANFTNRSVYPMLHILREESVSKALHNFPDPESIPDRNICVARSKGMQGMEQLLESCKTNGLDLKKCESLSFNKPNSC